MSIPGSTNGCFKNLIYLHGDTIINDSQVYDSSTAWPRFHIQLIDIYIYFLSGPYLFISLSCYFSLIFLRASSLYLLSDWYAIRSVHA